MFILDAKIDRLIGESITFRCTWKEGYIKGVPNSGTPINFAGCTAKLQFRVGKLDATPVLALTHTSGVFLGNSVVAPNLGFDITAEQSNTLGVGRWFYELQVTFANGFVRTFIGGKAKLRQDTTR